MGDASLSRKDVERLLKDRSSAARIETMSRMMAACRSGGFGAGEVALVGDILERLAMDAEQMVREAVAWQIYNSPLLSRPLAERLAQDVAEVAFPILRHAGDFTDDFLLRIIAEQDARKQFAIAGRKRVSAVVSDAIVESANLLAIECLVRNTGADIAEPTLHKTVDRFGAIDMIAEPLAERPELPLAVVEKLLHFVSEEPRRQLVEHHGLPAAIAHTLVESGREAALVLLLQPIASRAHDMEVLARHMHANGRLTPSLLFRALCGGDITLFLAGIAVRCGISIGNARRLVLDPGPYALRAVFEKAGLPSDLLRPFRVALGVLRETGYDGQEDGRPAYQRQVITRVFNRCSRSRNPSVQSLLLYLFDQCAETGACRDAARDAGASGQAARRRAATPGSSLPSSHSRKAPPAVET